MITRLLPLLLFLSLGLALAKSYVLESVVQEVFLRADGTVRVEDTRTLRLEGDFTDNEYFVVVDPAPGGSVRFEGVEALDGKVPAQAIVSDNEIAWKVRGQDETRRFRFSYVLTGELQIAEDAARLARRVLEPEHAPIESYRLIIHPPAPSPDNFRVFIFTGRGRIGSLDVAEDGSLATVTLPELSQDEDVLSVVLLDADVFDVQNVPGQKLEDWLAELERETADFRADSARRLAQARGPSPLWAIPVGLFALVMLTWFLRSYMRYGREPKTADVGPYYREPAERIPPAVVPYVLSQSSPGLAAAGPAIAASLLDFARRGYLRLETATEDGFLGFGDRDKVTYELEGEPQDLPGFEADLWGAFEGTARQNGTRVFDADDLRDYFKDHPSFAKAWADTPRDWYERTHGPLLDPRAGRRSGPIMLVSFLTGALSLFGAFNFLDASPLLGLSLLAAGILLIALAIAAGVALRRWHPDKLLNAKRWAAYKRFLSDFSLMREAPAEHYQLWDYHFVYATALGVSKAYLKNLRRLMSEEPERFVIPAWIAMHPGGLGTASSLSSLDALSGSLNTLSKIESNLSDLNSALAPQTKTGGGFGGSSGGFSGASGGGGSSGMR